MNLETLKSRRLSSVSFDLWLSFTVQLCLSLCFCFAFWHYWGSSHVWCGFYQGKGHKTTRDMEDTICKDDLQVEYDHYLSVPKKDLLSVSLPERHNWQDHVALESCLHSREVWCFWILQASLAGPRIDCWSAEGSFGMKVSDTYDAWS